MSAGAWLGLVGLGVAVLALVTLVRLRSRLDRSEARVRSLERQVQDLSSALDDVRRDTRAADHLARRAATHAGVPEELPRVALEPIVAPVVRALSWGAGARRTLVRLGRSRP